MTSIILYLGSPSSSISSAWTEFIALTFLKSNGVRYRYLKPCEHKVSLLLKTAEVFKYICTFEFNFC